MNSTFELWRQWIREDFDLNFYGFKSSDGERADGVVLAETGKQPVTCPIEILELSPERARAAVRAVAESRQVVIDKEECTGSGLPVFTVKEHVTAHLLA